MMIRNDPGGRYVNGSIGEVMGFTVRRRQSARER
jgi:ATP-dependent exoDNAse (exonuclease V) alpha subunit